MGKGKGGEDLIRRKGMKTRPDARITETAGLIIPRSNLREEERGKMKSVIVGSVCIEGGWFNPESVGSGTGQCINPAKHPPSLKMLLDMYFPLPFAK